MSSAPSVSPLEVEPASVGKRWTWSLVSIAIAWCAIGLLYQDTVVAMVALWYRSETFNHCFLVPPISIWLAWQKRGQLAAMQPRPAPAMLVLIAVCGFAWLLGELVAVNSVTQLALTTMMVLVVIVVLGYRIAAVLAFPLAYLFFAVPIGEFLMPRLMESTADFTIFALRASGIPVYREGLQFVIPTGRWSVVEACSGVRYLIASVSVGTLFAYLNYRSLRRRLLFVLVSIIVPIIANWLRAYMIVMLGHLSGNTIAVGVDHLIYGWLFFGVVIMIMFAVGARWSESPAAEGPASLSSHLPSGYAARALLLPSVVVLCVALLAAPRAAEWMIVHNHVDTDVRLNVQAPFAPGWQAIAPPQPAFKPSFKNPSEELTRAYSHAKGPTVDLYIGYYRNQTYERKLVSSDNVLVSSDDRYWHRTRVMAHMARLGSHTVTAELSELSSAPGRGQAGQLVALKWYWINGTLTSNDYYAKFISAMQRLMGRRDESAVIVVAARAEATKDAVAAIESFLGDNYSTVDAMLREAAGPGQTPSP